MGIDFRPANGLLYAFLSNGGATGSLVTINPFTGVMTTVAPGVDLPNGNFQGVDFNPVADAIRTVTSSNQSRRYNPTTGAVNGTDTPPAYAVGDPNQGQTPQISNVAYTNNFAGAGSTTLYGIDSALDVLVMIGSLNGTPISPNAGTLTTVGALGVNAPGFGGFDISGATATLYAVITASNATGLYTINPATGAATFAGLIGAGTSTLNGLSVLPAAVPEPSTWMMLAGGLGGLMMLRRRRR
jgi:hypothetical protein